MIAGLWHCPEPPDMEEYGVHAGAGTVGSTEACLLAGLALKFRWREWYAKRNKLSGNAVSGIRPNLVISSCYQAAWEKLFKYMDIEPKLIHPSVKTSAIDPEEVRAAIDENTMGVVCILGNHYGGQYDPVMEVDKVVQEVNQDKGYQVGIHVDAASGGFIAPFQEGLPAWDFRLDSVLSISTSGHKYGESCCGTGWVVWRQRKGLSEHVAISVTYLGGKADSYTLNFSRPASGVYVQYYKLLRYGMSGYQKCCDNMMSNAKYIRDGLRAMTCDGKPRFVFLDHGDAHCLPVVTAMLNPECSFSYDDIDLQHVLSQHHWYVSGYKMGLNHPITEENIALFQDEDADKTMFRIVIKNNLTRNMADHLLESFGEAFEFLDAVDFSQLHGLDLKRIRHKDQRRPSNHC
jgi:glutamate decarboxylase